MNETSLSLLNRLLSEPESESWNRLVHLYAPLLKVWLRKYDVQDNDADDLVQEVLLAVSKEKDAKLFKETLDKMVGFVGLLMAFGTEDPEDPEEELKAQKMQAALALLFLDQEGANLSKTVDFGLLQRLAAAGLPWTSLFEPGEGEESEEPDNDRSSSKSSTESLNKDSVGSSTQERNDAQ